MRVGVIQSNYIPWRGYFDFIDSVDLFVFHDDLQYTKNDWRNRNQVLTAEGPQWLTVPVKHGTVNVKIEETPIDYAQDWAEKHVRQLETHYRRAPFLKTYLEPFAAIIHQKYPSISELNITLCRWLMQMLDIHTPTMMSRDLKLTGKKTERLVDLFRKIGATRYLSGPSASAYLDVELLERNGIQVEYKSYDYPRYSQLGREFHGAVSVLDLLLNTGPDARHYLKSLTPDEVVIPADVLPQPCLTSFGVSLMGDGVGTHAQLG